MKYRHTLMVQLREKAAGSAGQRELVPVGAPKPVKGNVHPLDTAEIIDFGDRSVDRRRVFCKSWPGDIFSEITFEGAKWDQTEPAVTHGFGQNTQHVEIIIRKR